MKQLYEQKKLIEQQIIDKRLEQHKAKQQKKETPHIKFDEISFSQHRLFITVMVSANGSCRNLTFDEQCALSEHFYKLWNANPMHIEDLFILEGDA